MMLMILLLVLLLTLSSSLPPSPSDYWYQFQNLTKYHDDISFQVSFDNWSGICNELNLDNDMISLQHIDKRKYDDIHSKKKLRVLYLVTIRSFFLMMDRWMYQFYIALAHDENYDVTIWGIGMPGFNNSETTAENINRWFEDSKFDIVHTTWPYFFAVRDKLDYSFSKKAVWLNQRRDKEFSNLPHSPIISVTVHELDIDQPEINVKPNIVFAVYEQFLGVTKTIDACGNVRNDGCSLHPFLEKLRSNNPDTMLAFMPHGINKRTYEKQPIHRDNKKHDVLLVGATYKHIYPLRAAAQRAIKLTNVLKQIGHPGYAESWDISMLELCKYYHHSNMKQQERYVQGLYDSKVCLLGSASQLHDSCKISAWTVRKYYEALAAGCILIGDIPADIQIAGNIHLHLTEQKPLEIAYSVENFLHQYNQDKLYETVNKTRQYIINDYSYTAIIKKYFTPVIQSYEKNKKGGIFQSTLSKMIVRNDACLNDTMIRNSTTELQKILSRGDQVS